MKRRPRVFRRKGDKGYSFYFYDENNRRIFKKTETTSKSRAEEYADQYVKEYFQDEKIAIPTFKQYAENFFDWERCAWIKRQHAKDRSFSWATAKLRRGHLKKYLFPEFGKIKLDRLNPVKIEGWLLELKLANQTKNHILDSFNIILREAKRERLIATNPITDIERLADKHQEWGAFTLEEIKLLFPKNKKKLLKVWGHANWATMYYLMLTTGMRPGETGALLWRHVIWDLGAITILKAIKGDNSIGPPKNNEIRGVLLPKRTSAMLRWWQDQALFTEPDNYVFYGSAGDQHYNAKTIYRKIRPALKNVEINKAGRLLSARSMRHTYNTRMENVLTEAMLRYMVGHKSRAMTERYLHRTPEEQLTQFLQDRDKLDQAWN